MGIYNTFSYGDGTTYGQTSSIKLSVAPFDAIVLDSKKVSLTWVAPSGDFYALRLVRSQVGFSEHPEDGVVLFTDDASSVRPSFIDENLSVPLVDGKHAYYTAWVLLTDFTWMRIGSTRCLLPRLHEELAPDGTVLKGSTERFAHVLPKTYLTANGYSDVIDTNTDLYKFLSSMSLIVDEMYTNIENLTGLAFGEESTPEQAAVEAQSYGITVSPSVGMNTLKRLVRQAISNYQTKGTTPSLKTFSTALTGYASEVILSPNLLFNIQDSSFYKEVGDWKTTDYDSESNEWVATTGVTLTSVDTEDEGVEEPSPWALDTEWFGEVVTTGANDSISLGNLKPTLLGIPVTAGESYVLSFYAKLPTGTGTVIAKVTWFDRFGKIVGTPVTSSTTALTSTWQNIASEPLVAPLAEYETIDGATVRTTEPAIFAGISLSFSAAGTYCIDMIQLADSTDDRYEDFYEARCVEVFLHANKINHLYNSSFEELNDDDEIDGWTFGAPTTQVEASIDGVYHADYVAEMDTDGVADTTISSPLLTTTTTHTLGVGEFHTLSLYVRTTTGTTGNLNLALQFSDNVIEEVTDPVVTTFVATPTWQRVSVRALIPSYFTGRGVEGVETFAICSLYGDANDLVIQVDSAQLEQAYQPSDYFDGSLYTNGAFYSGDDPDTIDSNEDISFQYFNASSKLPTLNNELKNQLPYNTAHMITVGDFFLPTLNSWSLDA
jgi:hypothetical protein